MGIARMKAQEIATLLDENRYNPAIAPQLEEYVGQQVVGEEPYDLDANLALLKFYQLDPSKSNLRVVTNILIKALMQLPNSDFNLCLYLIPESVQREEAVNNLMLLSNLLESCDFAEFFYTFDEAAETVPFVENDQNRFKVKPSEQLEDYTTVFTKVLYSSAMTSTQ